MKKLNKKLTLNKETIASLNDAQMGAVKGGVTSIIACKTHRKKPPCYYTNPPQPQ